MGVITSIGGHALETAWWGPAPEAAPTLVLLHEGLGCVALWRDFPQRLAEATGCGVFAYSRARLRAVRPVSLPRPLSYMHDEARSAAAGAGRGRRCGAACWSAIPTGPRSRRSMPAACRILGCAGWC